MDLWFFGVEQSPGSVSREKHEPQAGPASCLSNSASIVHDASGDGVRWPEPNTQTSVTGEGVEGLPESKSVACAEGDTSNEGGPEGSCRTNCEGQAGRRTQRQEVSADLSGVGLAHSDQGQSPAKGTDSGEGANRATQPAQATSAVRKTGQDWPTFLRAIAEKASIHKQHRFGGWYRVA